jgi:hypothetical protein
MNNMLFTRNNGLFITVSQRSILLAARWIVKRLTFTSRRSTTDKSIITDLPYNMETKVFDPRWRIRTAIPPTGIDAFVELQNRYDD